VEEETRTGATHTPTDQQVVAYASRHNDHVSRVPNGSAHSAPPERFLSEPRCKRSGQRSVKRRLDSRDDGRDDNRRTHGRQVALVWVPLQWVQARRNTVHDRRVEPFDEGGAGDDPKREVSHTSVQSGAQRVEQ